MYLLELEFSPDIRPGVAFLDHTVTLFLAFELTSILFSTATAPIYSPPTVYGGSLFSTPFQDLLFVNFLMMVILTDAK